jgi:ribosomal-protein-alanine N-acetyltransferase
VFKIRHVEPNDIYPVIALAFETLPERYNPSIFNQFYESFPEGFFVALHQNTIIGFLIGVKTAPTTARILMLSVDQKHRKQGIGSALLHRFLTEMRQREVTQVDLEVRVSNLGALEFYKKQGFCLRGILHQFYQNGEHAYNMWKEL